MNIYLHDSKQADLLNNGNTLVFSASDRQHADNLVRAWNEQLREEGSYPSKYYFVATWER